MSGMSEDYYKSVSDSSFKRRDYIPYELEKYDRESLEEIKKFLNAKKYTDRKTIMEHLDYLEELANKVQHAIAEEKKDGDVTWELEKDLVEIKALFDKVTDIFEKHFSTKGGLIE